MHDLPNTEEFFVEGDDAAGLATLEPVAAGVCCEKCAAPMDSDIVTICRRCGWYASLGIHVEVDPNWEIITDEATEDAAPARSHLQVWLDLMPRWSWVILGSVLFVVMESIVVRLVTPGESALRTAWSLTQLLIGVLLVAGCHLFNFLVSAAEDTDFGILDLFLKPVKLWSRAVRQLPTRLWVVNSAACGAMAILMSLTVIGGIPYERFWDWGFQEPVKKDLMGAVMDRAKHLDSRNDSDSLEEAIGDFAGNGESALGGEVSSPKPAKPRRKTDCVILGYQTDRDGRLDTLLLGTAHAGKLIYIGRVAPDFPEEQRTTLLRTLKSMKRSQPFITIEAEGTWVEPKLTCRITFGEREKGGRLRDLEWDRLLGAIATE